MQAPHFAKLGLDLSRYHPGTLNVSIAPRQYRVLQPWRTFERLQWHPVEPAETFSFFEALLRHSGQCHDALIYLPHPETKPEHFQSADVLEVLAPWIDDLGYGVTVELEINPAQMVLE